MSTVHVRKIKRIAINTGGGDAPGLNAVIRAVTLCARRRGWEVVGLRNGYGSLLGMAPVMKLNHDAVLGIAALGGTILGTTNKGNPFETHVTYKGRKRLAADVIAENFKKMQLDGLIAIGGDGSMRISHQLMQRGIPIIGVPKTIDNDMGCTYRTFGFDTAVQTATEAIDKLHSTAAAHERIFVVEVMGRYAGWIALHSGLSGSCNVILIPEIPFTLDAICRHLLDRKKRGRSHSIVCVAEGSHPQGQGMFYRGGKEKGREQRLGGIAEWLAGEIQRNTQLETRWLVLGHLQRGGSPSTYDRLLALRYGAAAVRLAAEGLWGHMVSFQPPVMGHVLLEDVIRQSKCVSPYEDTVLTGREMGMCFGDEIKPHVRNSHPTAKDKTAKTGNRSVV